MYFSYRALCVYVKGHGSGDQEGSGSLSHGQARPGGAGPGSPMTFTFSLPLLVENRLHHVGRLGVSTHTPNSVPDSDQSPVRQSKEAHDMIRFRI